jgi:hypothetical protein
VTKERKVGAVGDRAQSQGGRVSSSYFARFGDIQKKKKVQNTPLGDRKSTREVLYIRSVGDFRAQSKEK